MGVSHSMPRSSSFRADILLNFCRRFGDNAVFNLRDELNADRAQDEIADRCLDSSGRRIHRTQLSRFALNTFNRLYILKPEAVELLNILETIRNERVTQNELDRKAIVLQLFSGSNQAAGKKS